MKYCHDCLTPIKSNSSEEYCNYCKRDRAILKSSDKLSSKKLFSKILTPGKINENFGNKIFDFNKGLESVIEINYKSPKESMVKLFFSKDDFETFSRNYAEKVEDNFIHFLIKVATKTRSSLLSGGNYEFNESDDAGYTLSVSMKYEDSQLLSVISDVLRSHKFGCYPSKHNILAGKNEKHPMEHHAIKLLSEITKDVSAAITSEAVADISMPKNS